MQMRGGGDGDGVDALRQQPFGVLERGTAEPVGDLMAMPTSFTPGISDSTRAWLLPITPTPTTPTRNVPSVPA
jgi:hypothetical protein